MPLTLRNGLWLPAGLEPGWLAGIDPRQGLIGPQAAAQPVMSGSGMHHGTPAGLAYCTTGTSGLISLANASAALARMVVNWTMAWRVRVDTYPANGQMLRVPRTPSGDTVRLFLRSASGNDWCLTYAYDSGGSLWEFRFGVAPTIGEDALWAITKRGSACTLFKNGVVVGTSTASQNIYWQTASPQELQVFPSMAGALSRCDFWDRALSGAELQAYDDHVRLHLVPGAGGGATIAIGQVSETDSAQALLAAQARAIGQASESDSAQSFSPITGTSLGQPSESDTAQPFVANQAAGIGQTAETDAALAFAALQAGSIGQAAETDAAQPFGAIQSRVLGLVGENDEALAAGVVGGAPSLGIALEADTSQALAAGQVLAIGFATESDSALAVVPHYASGLGLALEIDTAQAFAAALARALGIATETDLALAVSSGGAPPEAGGVPASRLYVPIRETRAWRAPAERRYFAA